MMILGTASQTTAQTSKNQREVRTLLQNILSAIDDFRFSIDTESRRALSDAEQDRIYRDADNLEAATTIFEGKFQRGRESAADVSEILKPARNIDGFLSAKQADRNFKTAWLEVRNSLDRLAAIYNINPSWNAKTSNYPNNYPTNTNSNPSYGLTGTYQLDVSRSENSRDILQRVNVQKETDRADLEDKLEAAEQIAIDIRGNQVVLASSNASPVSITADGVTRAERDTNGKTVRFRATLTGEKLTISSIGGETDYTVTFASIDNGRSLKVTRRITTDYLNQTIFSDSFYTKSDSVAGLGIDSDDNSGTYSSSDSNDYPTKNPNYPPTTTNPRNGTYIVPNGTILTGNLDHDVTTKVSQNNDRFRLTVTAPNQYRGAVIEGYLSGIERSGKVSGRSQVTFNFERIRLPNGRTYDFDGFLQSITDTDGKTIKVGTEGEAKSDSQTKETAKRGGIGAGIGAVIGAIAGGIKGAAIGAIIGGGAGAGSVIVTGKEDLELKQGSSITVQASAPNK